MEYDKTYAVYSNAVSTKHIQTVTDNLIHESGKLQLNTYQSFIKNFMNPQSDNRSLLLTHMTGTGKTISALATATEYVKQYQPHSSEQSIESVIVLGFTKDIFKKELLNHPEFGFVNMNEVKYLKDLEKNMYDSTNIAEQFHSKRKQFQRRLFKKDMKGIYHFYGYRQFANRVINMDDMKTMMVSYHKEIDDERLIDPQLIRNWIETGKVRLNMNFIKSLNKSLFICDEVHNLYSGENLNTYGLAIHLVFDYFFNKLPSDDPNFGSVRSLLLSATPLTSTALEIIPIIKLLTGDEFDKRDLFQTVNGINQLTSSGSSKIRQSISGKVSYIMDDNPKEYPSSSFEGVNIKDIDYLKFIRTKPIGHQAKFFHNFVFTKDASNYDKGSSMIKDICLPATKTSPNGVIFSKFISDLDSLPDSTAVMKSASGMLSSEIFKLKNLSNYSCKYTKMIELCLSLKKNENGKVFIYHPYVQGSGTDMICSILSANGIIMDGDSPSADSICLNCEKTYSKHGKDHDFAPVRFTYVNGNLAKPTMNARLSAFNNENNIYGERIKFIIGSRAMRESHTLKACRHIIITHEPSSISAMIQIVGRAVRKNVHAMLPVDLRSVKVHILTTDISDVKNLSNEQGYNEEYSYKVKVIEYKQIDMIERIIYDTSIDYLINFRFKLTETPPLLGESYELDQSLFSAYENNLTTAYKDLINGVALTGIHTNRFNIFYFEGEVKIVRLIIKRILLDYDPIITIRKLMTLIRDPPFSIEYNTKLISNESIAVAINLITFRFEHIRMITSHNEASIADSLFSDSPIIIDRSGIEYKIICIGHPLCVDTIMLKRPVSSIIHNDHSLIDSFKKVYSMNLNDALDLKDIASRWKDMVGLDDILEDLSSVRNVDVLTKYLHKSPPKSQQIIVEWMIENAILFSIKNKKLTDHELNLMKMIYDYYREKRLLVILSDLTHTRIYGRYKGMNVVTGTSWYSKHSKPSRLTMPVGHIFDEQPRFYDLIDGTWLELSNISNNKSMKHPFGFYIYEERDTETLNVSLKIKFEKEKRQKGINILFMLKDDVDLVAKKLKVDTKSLSMKKIYLEEIEKAAWKIQADIYPNRVIYRLIDL